ncbi:hypothetical protein MATL_G00046740 [Megalops atlanticus]|uniref:Vacuolar ATPase assembly integral membrane protein VMA21 n=1 Tax=Megalops atlanticus TaxID=7932 RepID=A0A9D3QAN9_MEGAT|nr:hypothetical protein MATL_G00046740 [Megalops atlanticus]
MTKHSVSGTDGFVLTTRIYLSVSIYAVMDRFDKTSINAMPASAQDFRGIDGSLLSALKTLLFFTIMMITLPIGLYFASKAYVFEASMGFSSNDSYFYAAIVAVVAVHVVLALFVYVAWNEGSGSRGRASRTSGQSEDLFGKTW